MVGGGRKHFEHRFVFRIKIFVFRIKRIAFIRLAHKVSSRAP